MNELQPCDLLLTGGTILDLAAPEGRAAGDAVAIRATDIVAVGPAGELAATWDPTETIDVPRRPPPSLSWADRL